MKILGIETSCDETSVALVEDGSVLHSLVVNSQIDIHKAFGGVVPEIAARSHIEVMLPAIQQALEEAFGASRQGSETRVKNQNKSPGKHDPYAMAYISQSDLWSQIDAIAVTQGPGLLGSLLIGVLTARTLAWSLNKPLYGIHHILGHIYANWITGQASPVRLKTGERGLESKNPYPQSPVLNLPSSVPRFPVLALIVSGGHTQLMVATSHTDWRVIGRTRDDAVGEAFDKVAKVLGLPYPGGPSVEVAAQNGNPAKYRLPSATLSTPYDFSFSGLKTAVLRAIQKECGVAYDFPSFKLAERLSPVQRHDFAASFQATAIATLVDKTRRAYDQFHPKAVIIGGGVAASQPLRKALQAALPIEIHYAPPLLCTDNAAMIAASAFYQAQGSEPTDPRHLETRPSWPL